GAIRAAAPEPASAPSLPTGIVGTECDAPADRAQCVAPPLRAGLANVLKREGGSAMGTNGTALGDSIRSCLFDLDGVLVNSVTTHATAWKEMFDAFLTEHALEEDVPFVPFDIGEDYERYVDGMKREDGVRVFLRSRGISLPEGHPDDPPEA